MKTNFFNEIKAMMLTGDLAITISNGSDNTLVVSLLLNNDSCSDEAKKRVVPLCLRGTADELDEGFFDNVCQPLQNVSGLFVNMEAFKTSTELARKQSAMEEKDKKSKDAKEKKYQEIMEKVDELADAGEYREAVDKLPNPKDYPDYAEDIRERRMELEENFQPSLFSTSNK